MSQEITATKGLTLLSSVMESRRIALPGDTWVRLLDTLRVSPANREADAREISTILTIGAICYGVDVRESTATAENLAASAAVAKTLRDRLLSFDIPERTAFEINAAGIEVAREPDAGARDRLAHELATAIAGNAMIGRYVHHERAVQAASDILAAATDFHHPPRRVGRAPRNLIDHPQERAFEIMAMMLYEAAAERGWYLTLSPNVEGGTLVDVLSILKPHLPAGLVPNVLNVWRLRDLRERGSNCP
jgi:hypothetical protein